MDHDGTSYKSCLNVECLSFVIIVMFPNTYSSGIHMHVDIWKLMWWIEGGIWTWIRILITV